MPPIIGNVQPLQSSAHVLTIQPETNTIPVTILPSLSDILLPRISKPEHHTSVDIRLDYSHDELVAELRKATRDKNVTRLSELVHIAECSGYDHEANLGRRALEKIRK